jgi:hypothetical protein
MPLLVGAGFAPVDLALGDLDQDGDLDIAVTDGNSGNVMVLLNQGNAQFAPAVGYFAGSSLGAVALADLDGDGRVDIALVADSVAVLRNLGGGCFGPVETYLVGHGALGLVLADLDADGRVDLAAADDTSLDVTVSFNLGPCSNVTPFCFGDGSGTLCPCSNSSAPGSGAGCTNSVGTGALLAAGGQSSLSGDTLVLTGSGMPASVPALYFQGTLQRASGFGIAVGDGLECAGGALVRMGVRFNTGGMSQFPGTGGTPISIVGHPSAGTTRTYQVWYRDPASFCTTSTFNFSNGVSVIWTQ